MELADIDGELRTKGENSDPSSNAGRTDFMEYERKMMESLGEDTCTEYGDETQSMLAIGERSGYLQIPFGFQSRGSYKHASKNCEIVGGNIQRKIFKLFKAKFMGRI